MTDNELDLKAILDARDAAIASLREQNRELLAQLLEKEANIQILKSAAALRERSANEHCVALEALAQTQSDLHEKEAVIAELGRACEEVRAEYARVSAQQNAQIAELHKAHEDTRSEYVRVSQLQGSLLEEKQAALSRLGEAHAGVLEEHARLLGDIHEKVAMLARAAGAGDADAEMRLNRSVLLRELDQKEACIRELNAAVEAYRSAHPGLYFLAAPLRVVAGVGRRAGGLVRQVATPRLGNLNQHAPIELFQPADFPLRCAPDVAPLISIVTPSYMQASFIERTIDSVVSQRYPNLEYYVQDGGSTDGTREILERRASDLSGWVSQRDGGQTEAINLGFARTSGDIMAWLNSDDLLMPGTLAYVADYFARHPDVDVLYGHRLLIDENDKQIGRWIMPAHSNTVLSWVDFVPQETLFWRRRIWDKAGARVDESFRFAMDWDLLLRMRDAGAKFARVPRALGAFRIHTQQKTSASISDIGFKEMNRLRERALGRLPSSTQINAAIAPYLARHIIADIAWRLRAGR